MPDAARRQLVEECCLIMHNAYGVASRKKKFKKWEEMAPEKQEPMRVAVSAVIDFLSERLMHHGQKPIEKMPNESPRTQDHKQ